MRSGSRRSLLSEFQTVGPAAGRARRPCMSKWLFMIWIIVLIFEVASFFKIVFITFVHVNRCRCRRVILISVFVLVLGEKTELDAFPPSNLLRLDCSRRPQHFLGFIAYTMRPYLVDMTGQYFIRVSQKSDTSPFFQTKSSSWIHNFDPVESIMYVHGQRHDTESIHKRACLMTNRPDTNPNHNPNTKQHAAVSIQRNIVTCRTHPDNFILDRVIAPF